jgi:hypothetical protein
MSSSFNPKRNVRRIFPIGEPLEGRQLLSTAADTIATAAVAPADTSTTAATQTTPPVIVGRGHHGHPAHLVRAMPIRGRKHGPSTMPAGFAAPAFQAPTNATAATAPDTAATTTTGTTTTAIPTVTVAGDPSTQNPVAWASQGNSQAIGDRRGGFGGRLGMPFMRASSGSQSIGMVGGFGQGMPGGPGSAASGGTTFSVRSTAFQKLQTDTQAIMDKSQVTPALQATLRDDLQAISKAATTAPDEAKLLALQSDILSDAGTLSTSAKIATLGDDFAAVVASEGVTDATLAPKAISDLNAVIAATGINSGDIATLTADLKAAGLITNTPLGPMTGVQLDILGQAIYRVAPTATIPASTPTTTASTGTATS